MYEYCTVEYKYHEVFILMQNVGKIALPSEEYIQLLEDNVYW
jgi:hypothetical protein